MHTWKYACFTRNAEMSDIRKIVSEIFFFKTKGEGNIIIYLVEDTKL